MQITIHKKHKHIYKYIKQIRIKKLTGKFVPKVFHIHDLMEVFITLDESSAPSQFYLAASKVMLVFTPCDEGVNSKTPLCTNNNPLCKYVC